MYYLFLDDERVPSDVTWKKLPPQEWVIVRNYFDFVKKIESDGLPECMSLDRDLADEHLLEENELKTDYKEKTGEDCLLWVLNYCVNNQCKFPEIIIHTMNPIGRTRMILLVKDFLKEYPELLKRS